MSPFNKTPVSDQYNLSIQQEIFRNTVVQVAYAGNKANHLATQREADTAIPIILPNGQPFYPGGAPRRNPAWNGIIMVESNANSDYNSLMVTLRRQSSSGFVGQIFYTFSKAMDEASNTGASESLRSPAALLDPNNLGRDWGLADFDSRHSVVANFSYPLPFRARSKAMGTVVNGWTFDGIGTFTAGQPFAARLASSVSRDLSSQLSERPDLKPGASQNPNHSDNVNTPMNLPDYLQTGASRRQYTTLQANSILSPNALNSFRFAFNRTRTFLNQAIIPDPGPQLDIIPGQPFGTIQVGAIIANGTRPITQLGTNNGKGAYRWWYNVFEWADDFNYVRRKHSLKTGVDMIRLRDNSYIEENNRELIPSPRSLLFWQVHPPACSQERL